MADYTVTFARSARKELETLDTPPLTVFSPKLKLLPKNHVPGIAVSFKEKEIYGVSGLGIIGLFMLSPTRKRM